jgi:hypothetical protein
MRTFLVSYTAQLEPGSPSSPGRCFVNVPAGTKVNQPWVEGVEATLRQRYSAESVAINNVVELES